MLDPFGRVLKIGAVLLLLFGTACEDGDEPVPRSILPTSIEGRTPAASPTTGEALVIGLVGTLSGPDSWRGEDAFEGADLALQVLNRGRGPVFELVTRDDAGDVELAVEQLADLAASERTVGIVYAGPPEALPEVEDELADAGIPALLCYGDLYSGRALSPHVFQVSPPLVWQARRIARYVGIDRGYEDIGVMVERSVQGSTAVDAIATAFEDVGSGPSSVTYAYDLRSLEGVLEELERKRVEAIVFQGSPAAAAALIDGLDAAEATFRGSDRARIASARKKVRRGRERSGSWHPQVIAFDLAITPRIERVPPGTIAADTYARGAHFLPIPSLDRFREAFVDWWGVEPLGWERRAYEATGLIGRAVLDATKGEDIALALERIRGNRFGGLDVTFGPDDHTATEPTTVGLWVVPERGDRPPEADIPSSLPWVPLARGFSIDGQRTDVLPEDWRYLFRPAPPPGAPAPRFKAMRMGVTTGASSPAY